MRIRKKKWAEPELSVCDFFIRNPEEHAGSWRAAFAKEQPLYLEIGCGKGGFAGQFALKYPERNIIALDIKIDMLGVGRRTIVKLFEQYQAWIIDENPKTNDGKNWRENNQSAERQNQIQNPLNNTLVE